MANKPKGPAFKVGDSVYKINPNHCFQSNNGNFYGNFLNTRRGKIVKYIAGKNRAKRTIHYYDVLFDNEGSPKRIGEQTLRLLPRTPAETITTKS